MMKINDFLFGQVVLVALQIAMILPLLLIASQINNLAECKKISLISIISVLCPTQCQEGQY